MEPMNQTLTLIPGLRVGHAHDSAALTGCTVVLCPAGAVGGVDQRGGAPGTRETDLLRPLHLVEQGAGYETAAGRVPIVPAAVIFDLGLGSARVRPDAAMGYAACQAASAAPLAEGNVGAGMGASVGKLLGPALAMKSGLGSAAVRLDGGLIIAALAVVNALGDVVDPDSGRILAGARLSAEPGAPFAGSLNILRRLGGMAQPFNPPAGNTTIGVVATNARLTKEQANLAAQMAQDGLARAVRPAHTLFDGDTIFTLATGVYQAESSLVGALAAEVFAQAVVRAVQTARSAGGLPGLAGDGAA